MFVCICRSIYLYTLLVGVRLLFWESHEDSLIYLSICLSVDLSIYVCMSVCIYLSIYVCTYVCIYLSIYVCMYVCIYSSIYLLICVPTYLSTYMQRYTYQRLNPQSSTLNPIHLYAEIYISATEPSTLNPTDLSADIHISATYGRRIVIHLDVLRVINHPPAPKNTHTDHPQTRSRSQHHQRRQRIRDGLVARYGSLPS